MEAHKISSWMAPDDIPIGQTWEEVIVEAISTSSAFLLLWSDKSQNSAQVKRELSLAASHGKLILPLRLDQVIPKGVFAYYLTNTHWHEIDCNHIEQCSLFIIENLLGALDPKARNTLAGPKSPLATQNARYNPGSNKQGKENTILDLDHLISIPRIQTGEEHTRIIKIEVGESTESLEVKIPARIKSGTRLRLRGKGNKCQRSGQRGDLYLVVHLVET